MEVITLTQKQRIIMDHLNGVSNRDIARTLHISKDTVNKYVKEYDRARAELLTVAPDAEQTEIIQAFVDKPAYDSSGRSARKVDDEILATIEECLRLNATKRASGMQKQEMKKIDIHEYLIGLGHVISYSTVKRLVRDVERRHAEAFIRQDYTHGEICEFDWGTVKLNIGGRGYQKYQMAVFTAAKSNDRYGRLYRSQDTAAFQDAHAEYFQYCHGAFHVMVYDNMKVAVKRFVGLTEKEPTVALTQLSLYYGFRFRFCNIASGNEKGHVERSVEYVRRKVFSAPLCDCFDTLAEANAFLVRECAKLNAREISNHTIPSDVFAEEQNYLLPAMPKFESCLRTTGKVDKYSTVVVAQVHYSVPDTLVGKEVEIRLYTDSLTIYYDCQIVAKHERSFRAHDWKIDIYHYLRTLKRKPGALRQSTALLQADKTIQTIYENYYTQQPKVFLDVLEIICEQGVEPVAAACKQLDRISPFDMSADKVAALCDSKLEVKTMSPGHDRLSAKSKSTLPQYDMLRRIQAGKPESEAV